VISITKKRKKNMKLEKFILVIYDDGNSSTILTAFHTKDDAYKAKIEHAQVNYNDHFYDEGG